MKPLFTAMRKAGLSLAFFALISVVFVTATQDLTKDSIIKNEALFLMLALNEVLETDRYDHDLVNSKVIIKAKDTGFAKDTPVYLAH